MPFIAPSEANNAYFTRGEATNELHLFSLQEMKYINGIFMTKIELLYSILSVTDNLH